MPANRLTVKLVATAKTEARPLRPSDFLPCEPILIQDHAGNLATLIPAGAIPQYGATESYVDVRCLVFHADGSICHATLGYMEGAESNGKPYWLRVTDKKALVTFNAS